MLALLFLFYFTDWLISIFMHISYPLNIVLIYQKASSTYFLQFYEILLDLLAPSGL